LNKYLYTHGNPVNWIDPSGYATTAIETSFVQFEMQSLATLRNAAILYAGIILFTKRWEVNLHFDGIHASVVAQRIWGNVAYTYDWRFEKRGLAPARGWRFKQSGKPFEGWNLPGTAFLGEIGFRIWEKFIGFQGGDHYEEYPHTSLVESIAHLILPDKVVGFIPRPIKCNCWYWAAGALGKAELLTVLPF